MQSGTYIGMANFVMLLASVKQLYEINISAYLLVPLGFLVMIALGFIDYQFISQHYIKHVNRKNDVKQDTELIINILNKK